VQAEDLNKGTGPEGEPRYMVGIGVESLGDEVSSAHLSDHDKDTMENNNIVNIMNTADASLAVITGPRNNPSGLSVLVTAYNTGQEVQFSSSDSFTLTAGTESLPNQSRKNVSIFLASELDNLNLPTLYVNCKFVNVC
jgi:hypothetical protein